jgi:hypothetical protein
MLADSSRPHGCGFVSTFGTAQLDGGYWDFHFENAADCVFLHAPPFHSSIDLGGSSSRLRDVHHIGGSGSGRQLDQALALVTYNFSSVSNLSAHELLRLLRLSRKAVTMSNAVYCSCSSESQSNAILIHLRNAGFSSEISVFLKNRSDTKDMSMKEDAVRGAEIGGVVGALVSLAIPGIGPTLLIGPIMTALGGAAAGGAVGGLMGGTGAFKPLHLPREIEDRIAHEVNEGNILIAVHSEDSQKLSKALAIFRSENAEEIYDSREEAA